MASRIADTLMEGRAFSKYANASMVNPALGGNFGYAPVPAQYINNKAYIRKNIIAIVLRSPRFFDLMPDPAKWHEALRAIIELRARKISGLNGGLKGEFAETPVGGAGEVQHELIDMKRDQSEVTIDLHELEGMPIQQFLYSWMTYGMMDPDVKYALINTIAGVDKPTDYLPDWFTMSALFMEPDTTHSKVVKSWVGVNMMPRETGEIKGERDLTTASEILELSIPFTGIYQFNFGTNTFAQQILDQINLTNANPYLRPSIVTEIDPSVQNAKGYAAGVADLASSALTR